ncbi:XDD4 family exosortase-dependent surface protein [Sphingomonas sp.]|uniref:XDD4 family exosortase-dependent surface protein n=1 Tax=Sphingomonas sp. TaxID=28214 RepID=UPI0038A11ED9
MRRILTAAAAATAIGLATPATAATVFTGTNGSNLSASATFDIVAGNLMVTLTNTSAVDINDPAQVLHALFFDITSNPALTYTSANICGTCSFVGTVSGTGTNVGAEWAYKQNASGLGGGVTQDYGLSSAGYGIFGPGDVLSGAPDRGGATTPPDGGDFGLLSAGYSTAGDNGGITNNQPYIKNSVTFSLGAFDGSLASVSNVRFQYGTATTDTHFGSGVPEPATWAMMLLGFGGIGVSMRRRRKPGLAQLA